MDKTLIIILGPTAVGKSSLSIELAKLYNTEIISADSRQIYKELSIGTAVPDSQELNTVKHHCIHNHSMHDYFSASDFEVEALEILDSIFKMNNIAVMTGGSMMYIDALCNGIDDLPSIDHEIRNQLITRFEKEGIEPLRFELKKIDPEYYNTSDIKNPKRILHALEIFYMTGKKYSSLRTNTKKQRNFNIVKIGLNTDRKILHEKINLRVDEMINKGLVEEARSVYQFRHLNSLKTVGYRELFGYFDNEYDLATAIELIKRNSRRYARRQLTWFNRDKEINWFNPEDKAKIFSFIDNLIVNK